MVDATRDDIVEMEARDARKDIEARIDQKIAMLRRGERAYFQFTMSWRKACEWAKEVHGPGWKPPKREAAGRRSKRARA